MGSRKKKKNNQAKRGGGSGGAPRSVQKDKYAKYAGAVSNKSKRNYADLKLVRPENLTDYASENARPRTEQPPAAEQGKRPGRSAGHRSAGGQRKPSGGAKAGPSRSAAQSAVKKPQKPQANAGGKTKHSANAQRTHSANTQRSQPSAVPRGRSSGGVGNVIGGWGAWVGSVSSGAVKSVTGKNRPPHSSRRNAAQKPTKPAASAPSGRAPRNPAYEEDEYSRALNNLDFYGNIVEKYYLKYPEKKEERQSSRGAAKPKLPKPPKSSKVRKHLDPMNGVLADNGAASQPQKSIAELAVKNRGTAGKRKQAKVVKTGKAKGSVPVGTVHRKVHRRNRRQSLFIGAAATASAALVMISVIFVVFFKVKKIEVAGETPYSDSRITELCEFNKGDNLMFIDTVNSEQQVLDALPYIESCRIRRTIPNMVEVNVTCANALGVMEIGNGFWSIVSTGGKILENVTNVAVVSSSDIVMSVSYEPDIHSAAELAAAKDLPVLSGLEFKDGKVGEYVIESSMDSVNGFDKIVEQAGALGMRFTKLKYTSRGYEVEYAGRINIVLGDWADDSVLKKRIQVANYIICEQGDISEHEMGELTFLKNQTVFSPTYDISDEEIARLADEDGTDDDMLLKFAQSLLDKGIGAEDESAPSEEEETPPPADNPIDDIADGDLTEAQPT